MKRLHKKSFFDPSWKQKKKLLLNLIRWHFKICFSHLLQILWHSNQIRIAKKKHKLYFMHGFFTNFFQYENKKIEIKNPWNRTSKWISLESGNNECYVLSDITSRIFPFSLGQMIEAGMGEKGYDDVNLPIAQLAEKKCSNHFTNSIQYEWIRLIEISWTNPILMGYNGTFVPLLIKITDITF